MIDGKKFIAIWLASIAIQASGIYVTDDAPKATKTVTKRQNQSPVEWTEEPYGPFSALLEEFTLNQSPANAREGRIIQNMQPQPLKAFKPSPQEPFIQPITQQSLQMKPIQQQTRYIPTNSFYMTRRSGEEELDPNMRPPVSGVIAKVSNPNSQHKPNYPQSLRQQFVGNANNGFNSPREVSETDLYLLGAIEKLVYRVDYMEKRLKRTEQLVYYLMQGNKQKPEADPCPTNFSRVGEDCFHFNVKNASDWKTANLYCKSMGANLAEFEKISKFQDVIAHILNNQSLRGHDFWLGALNPGLLWIWANSARPVNPSTNITTISDTSSNSTSKVPTKVEKNPAKDSTSKFPEITGTGRCLRLSFNPAIYSYGYTGRDCAAKHNVLCEITDKTLDNEIKRIAKELKFD